MSLTSDKWDMSLTSGKRIQPFQCERCHMKDHSHLMKTSRHSCDGAKKVIKKKGDLLYMQKKKVQTLKQSLPQVWSISELQDFTLCMYESSSSNFSKCRFLLMCYANMDKFTLGENFLDTLHAHLLNIKACNKLGLLKSTNNFLCCGPSSQYPCLQKANFQVCFQLFTTTACLHKPP